MDPESTQGKLVDFDEEKRRQRGQHGNGGGNTIAERLARLETRIQYLATEAYIEKKGQLAVIGVNWSDHWSSWHRNDNHHSLA